jgi:hypothetical protein
MTPLERAGQPGPREEVESPQASPLQPPHVPGQDEGAPLQASSPAPNAVPPLPANASGHDTMPPGRSGHTQDSGSMYEGRREEDKAHEPGDG